MSQEILPLAVWESGTNNNSIPANDNALRVEVALKEAISIADSEPGSPSERDLHIIGTSWGGFTTNNAVIYLGGTWYEFEAFDGWFKTIAGDLYNFDGSDWKLVTSGGGGIPDAPSDGATYGRKDGDWSEITGGGGGGAASIFDPGKPGGTLESQKNEYFSVDPDAEVDLANVASGAGYISSLFLAFYGADYAWRDAEIRIYYDGESEPSVLMRHENFFFGQYAATNSAFSSEFFGHNRAAADTYGGYMNLPIPYTNGVRVTVKNVSATSFQLFSTTIIHRGVANTWPRTKKLLAKQFYVDAAAPDSVQTIIDETASNGRLAAMWLLGDGLPGGASPRSAWLEGNIRIYLDGALTPAYESSGTEDYFLLSFYFGGVGPNRNGGEVGTTFINTTAGTYGAWRTHVRNPIEFNTGIRVTWQVGDTSQAPFTGTVRAWATVFYYVG